MWRRAAAGLVVVAVSAIALSACSDQSGLSLAQEACGRVHSSIALYDAGIHATSHATMVRDLTKANDDLQAAEPLAAAATSANGQWNALMTTLNELGQVDEGHLISALEAQCEVANSNQPGLPNLPTTFPPVPSTTHPGTSRSTTTTPTDSQKPITTS